MECRDFEDDITHDYGVRFVTPGHFVRLTGKSAQGFSGHAQIGSNQ